MQENLEKFFDEKKESWNVNHSAIYTAVKTGGKNIQSASYKGARTVRSLILSKVIGKMFKNS